MADEIIFKGTIREDVGKGASRRLRHQGDIPAIVYGGGRDAVSIVLNHNEVLKNFTNEDIYSSILAITVGDKKQQVILRDVQRHPFKPVITHLDFMRVRDDVAIRVEIPIEILNAETAKGIMVDGGQLIHDLVSVEVSCLPKDLPSVIELDIAELELGHSLHISDLPELEGVSYVDIMNEEEMNDQPVVSIVEIREYEEPEDEEVLEAVDGEEIEGEEADEEGASEDEENKDE